MDKSLHFLFHFMQKVEDLERLRLLEAVAIVMGRGRDHKVIFYDTFCIVTQQMFYIITWLQFYNNMFQLYSVLRIFTIELSFLQKKSRFLYLHPIMDQYPKHNFFISLSYFNYYFFK